MSAELFLVPEPETVVLFSRFDGGETFRSGLTRIVGQGRFVTFRPGQDAFPVVFHRSVRRVIAHSARWVVPGSDS